MEDYAYGKTYIDPKHVSDGGVTPDHVRRWKVLQELQVRQSHHCVLSFLVLSPCSMPTLLVTRENSDKSAGWQIMSRQDLQQQLQGGSSAVCDL